MADTKRWEEMMGKVSFKRSTVDVMDNKSAVGVMVERTRSHGKRVVHYSTKDGKESTLLM